MQNTLPPVDIKQALRQAIRQKRRALTEDQQKYTGAVLADSLKSFPPYHRAQRIAFYLKNDGEADPKPLLEDAMRKGKACYLPVLAPIKNNELYFVRYDTAATLANNRFGMEEPELIDQHIAPLWTLDIVFMPLVAFDRTGTRLGMGGGYYDRTLANTSTRQPLLIGLAHSCQEVNSLERSAWDIPMDAIATEKELIVIDSSPLSGQKPT